MRFEYFDYLHDMYSKYGYPQIAGSRWNFASISSEAKKCLGSGGVNYPLPCT